MLALRQIGQIGQIRRIGQIGPKESSYCAGIVIFEESYLSVP